MQARSLSFALLTALTAAACAPESSAPSERLGSNPASVRDGYDDTTGSNVIGILDLDRSSVCTGSLIGPNLVMTAQHCVAPVFDGPSGPNCGSTYGAAGKPNTFIVTTSPTLSLKSPSLVTVREIIVYPPGVKGTCGNDYAMLVLDENIAPETAVPLVPRIDQEVVVGEVYSAAGYGITGENKYDSGRRRRIDGRKVECLGFDCGFANTSGETEWGGDGHVCHGDSGGPALDSHNRVIGVTARADEQCIISSYESVAAASAWIIENALHAAQLGGYEAPSWARGFPTSPDYYVEPGGTCTTHDDCGTKACGHDQGYDYCTRPCNDAVPCPNDYECSADYGFYCRYIGPPAPTSSAGVGGGSASGGGGDSDEPKSDGGDESGGCSVKPADTDPTKPIPWKGVASFVAFGLVAVARRRRR